MMESLKNIKLCKKCNRKCGCNDSFCRVFYYFTPYCLIFQHKEKKAKTSIIVQFQYLVIIQTVMNVCFRVRTDSLANAGK